MFPSPSHYHKCTPTSCGHKPAAASSTSHTKGPVATLPQHRTGKSELFLFCGCMAHCTCPVAPWALDRVLATSPAVPAPATLDRFQLIIQIYSNPVHETVHVIVLAQRGRNLCLLFNWHRTSAPFIF